MTESFVIGVDAGGTKTAAWRSPTRCSADDQPIETGTAGPGNVNSVGFETATTNIRAAIESAMRGGGAIDCLCICAAGAGRTEQQSKLLEWAISLEVAKHVHIGSDIDALLAAGSDDSTGVALIAGTGSLAAGRNAEGKTHRAGGWGWLLDDEGSAYRIGLTALQHAVRMADGREPETPLLSALLEQLSLASASELISLLYPEPKPRTTIAQLSRCVFAVAVDNDAVASAVISDAADQLSVMVQAVVRHLDLPPEYTLAMTGGVLTSQPAYRDRVLALLSREPNEATIVETPVLGAVKLAQRFADRGCYRSA